ncbi:MAG: glycosyltransferase family 9 protein [Bdellovibrio sp.]|nr:glycosyltransferase family 9 protein [Bdellovibrio sp.]
MIVAINRTDAIGDTLLTLPMAKVIKHHYPDAKIIFIISPRTQELFTNTIDVDDVWMIDPQKNWAGQLWSLYQKFRKYHVDTYFYVGGMHWITFCAWLAGVAFRGGLISRWPSFLFLNQGLRQSRRMVVMHEAEYNLNLLAGLEIDWSALSTDIWKENLIKITEEEREQATKILHDTCHLSPDRPYIVIHPGMSGHTLNWSSRNYGRLITRLLDADPEHFQFIVSYTPSDLNFLLGIKDHLGRTEYQKYKGKIHFFDGSKIGLRLFMAVLSKAKLFVGPSTGPTHLATALGTPVVALYSPIKIQSAKRWGPLAMRPRQVKIIVPDVVCGEVHHCSGEVCPYFECMGIVEVEDVVKEVNKLLKNSKSE